MQKLLLLVGLCVLVAHFEATCSQRLVCTFQSVPGFNIASDMEPLLCTHIIFKSVQPNSGMVIPSSGGPIQDHRDFKTAFPSATTKTLLEVDLTDTPSAIFTPSNRATFITSVIAVVNNENFDGVNIVWSQSEDNATVRSGFTALMEEMKAELSKRPLPRLLTASVSGVPHVIDYSYEFPQLNNSVDFFNVMTADLDRTSLDGTFPKASAGMEKWVVEGVPKAKLNMGIATYGFDTNINASPRIFAKHQVCAAMQTPVTFVIDSDMTIDAKAEYVVDEQFGGAFVTSLELDDFAGSACVPGTYPVIRRIKAQI